MLSQQERHLFLVVQVFDDVEHLFNNLRRQTHAGFVQQHHAGVGHQRAPNGTHLLLATRGVGGLAGAACFEAGKVVVDLLQVACNLGLVFTGVGACHQVFFNGEVGKAVPPFHDLHHAALHQIRGRQVFNALTAQLNTALGNFATLALEQIGHSAKRGGFACAIATQDGHDATLRHLQRDALEHEDHVVIDNLDAVDVENDVFGFHGFTF